MTRGAKWFVSDLLPRWLRVAMRPDGFVAESLDADGRPDDAPPTVLTQARTVFALAHLHLVTGDPTFLTAARRIHAAMDATLRDPDGGYRVSADLGLRRSYDQSFALLALVTLRRADPSAVAAGDVDALWSFIAGPLTEPATGALWQDDAVEECGQTRGQNPHMHMLEAVLQAHEMTGDAVWLNRAAHFVMLARRYFIDPETGAVREFVGPDLAPMATPEGARREPGHQYEWAWLLHRFADRGGDGGARDLATRMIRFVEAHGLRADGPMAGAPFDALDARGGVTEDTHLLWPLTEAGKFHAAMGDTPRLRAIEAMIFERCFADRNPTWVNRIDGNGDTLWPTALSRLVYHVALFVTEGARAGAWSLTAPERQTKRLEETPT